MQIKPLSKIKRRYKKMNFYEKRNISGVLLDNFKVFLSIFTKDVVIFSHILPPVSKTFNRT